jgi:hypothetical protein
LEPVLVHTPAARSLEGKADRILGLNVLHELGDAALRELISLLKPGGDVLLIDWNSQVKRDVGPPQHHVYSPDQASARVENAGLRVQSRQLFRYHYALVCNLA